MMQSNAVLTGPRTSDPLGWPVAPLLGAMVLLMWMFVLLQAPGGMDIQGGDAYFRDAALVTGALILLAAAVMVKFAAQARREVTLRRAEQDYLSKASRFEAIFDHAAVGIGVRSLDGRWLLVNSKLCNILGSTSEDLIGKPILHHIHPNDVLAVREDSEIVSKGEWAWTDGEKRVVRPDGSDLWVHLSSAPARGESDSAQYIISVVQDISRPKIAEFEASALHDELEERVARRTSQLVEANKHLESFSYSVSHDLRTPLRAISGFAQILARRHRSGLNDEGQRYVDNIVRASTQMGRLIEDLLAYSRLGRRSVRLEPVNLADVFAEVLHSLQGRIAAACAQVHIPEQSPTLHSNHTLLAQIFLNLLDNALLYATPGRPPVVEVRFRRQSGGLLVTVADNGIGIASDHFESIFGVFQRLHNQDEYPGTGIGLASVKRAVGLLGGEVSLDSKIGQGSQFHISLPASAAGHAPSDRSRAAVANPA